MKFSRPIFGCFLHHDATSILSCLLSLEHNENLLFPRIVVRMQIVYIITNGKLIKSVVKIADFEILCEDVLPTPPL